MSGKRYSEEYKIESVRRIEAGEITRASLYREGPDHKTVDGWMRKYGKKNAPPVKEAQNPSQDVGSNTIASPPIKRKPKKLYVDIETLPNMGFFYETYNDKRSIPLDFILKPKAIVTIQYAFNDDEPTVLIANEMYEDKDILEQFLPIFDQADYVVWHYGDNYDKKFLDGRLFLNELPPLKPVATIDTCKLARAKFGKTLNSNSLGHIAKLLGIEAKGNVTAAEWVAVAMGCEDTLLNKVVPYGAQDIVVMRQLEKRLRDNVDTKENQNIHTDSPVMLCEKCGSDNLTSVGKIYRKRTFRHVYRCEKGHTSDFAPTKVK